MMRFDGGSRWWVALLLMAGAVVDPVQLTAQATADAALPEEVVRAWEKAGATVGWMGIDRQYGYLRFTYNREELAEGSAVPAFRLARWQEGRVVKLPAPSKPFGLDLQSSDVTDTGLKELAKLQQLTTLDLWGTEVTDAGVAELRKALPRWHIIR
ncbi:MAG: hypothetical protein RMJ88_14030 [Thermogemmata sp.]|nr:hypothetical protein [Thermogemmata sp.]